MSLESPNNYHSRFDNLTLIGGLERQVLEDWATGSAPAASPISAGMMGARTDPELRAILYEHRDKTVCGSFPGLNPANHR